MVNHKWRFYDLEERAEDFMIRGLIDKELVVDFVVKVEENKVRYSEAKTKKEKREIILNVRTDGKKLEEFVRKNINY